MSFLDNKFTSRDFVESSKEDGGLRKKLIFKSDKINQNLISILTVVKNGEKYLEECILSVANLNYKNYEHIIVDGGSTDKTLQIIKKYEDLIDYWCSNLDLGLYDGFNTALTLSAGQNVINAINAPEQEQARPRSTTNTYEGPQAPKTYVTQPATLPLPTRYDIAKQQVSKTVGTPTSVGLLAVNNSPFYDFLKTNNLNRGIL